MNDDDLKRSVSGKLRAVLAARGWTVRKLSSITGIPKQTLDAYMQARQLPSASALHRLQVNGSVDVSWLLSLDRLSGLSGDPASMMIVAEDTIRDILLIAVNSTSNPDHARLYHDTLAPHLNEEAKKWAVRIRDRLDEKSRGLDKAADSESNA